MNVASFELSKQLFELSWKKIDGLPYEVSNDGQIRSIRTGRVRKLWTDKDGYLSFSYKTAEGKIRNLFVHIAVAKAFVPFVSGKYEVNHKDSNPAHNYAHNLEWCTPGENVEHSRTHGKADRYQNRGEKHGMHKLTVQDVQLIRNHKGMYSGTFVALLFKVSPQAIYDIWNGRRWKHVA